MSPTLPGAGPGFRSSNSHASLYFSYFDLLHLVCSEMDFIPRISSSGMMYHASSNTMYAARKSNDPGGYGSWQLHMLQSQPSSNSMIVDFTCTATKCRGRPTTKSKLLESPQGLLTGNPISVTRSINRSSAHSPRSFLPTIFGTRFFIDPPQK